MAERRGLGWEVVPLFEAIPPAETPAASVIVIGYLGATSQEYGALLGPLLALALVAGPVAAQQDVDKVFGAITAESNREYGALDTVNGSITIRSGARVRSAETVNGSISIHQDARVGNAETVNGAISLDEGGQAESLETVNGGISIERGARVTMDVEAVNGSIRIAELATVSGDASNVNGSIRIEGGEVGGTVTTTNGDITLRGAVVRGDLVVEKPDSSWWKPERSRLPRVIIDADSVVEGRLVFEREVELYVHPDAKVGKQSGVSPRMIDSPDAPRQD